MLSEFVKVTQAAEQIRAKSLTMKNQEFVSLVKLLREYDQEPPAYYFRCSQHQYCLTALRASDIDGYIDSSRSYLDKKLKEIASKDSFDMSMPQLRYLQADTTDPEDIESFSDITTLNFFNDTVLLLVKADQSVETLQPLLVLCRRIVHSWREAGWVQWSHALEGTTIVAAFDNVLRTCLGFIAHLSPIPGDLGCSKADADFITCDVPKDTPSKKRRLSGKQDQSQEDEAPAEDVLSPDDIQVMAQINDTSRAMQRYICKSEGAWKQVLATYVIQWSVDAAWEPKIQAVHDSLDAILDGPAELGAGDAEALTTAITTGKLAVNKLRPGGTVHVDAKINTVLTQLAEPMLQLHEPITDEGHFLARASAVANLAAKAGNADITSALQSHIEDVKSKSNSGALTGILDAACTYTTVDECLKLQRVLEANEGTELLEQKKPQLLMVQDTVLHGYSGYLATAFKKEIDLPQEFGEEWKFLLKELAFVQSGERKMTKKTPGYYLFSLGSTLVSLLNAVQPFTTGKHLVTSSERRSRRRFALKW